MRLDGWNPLALIGMCLRRFRRAVGRQPWDTEARNSNVIRFISLRRPLKDLLGEDSLSGAAAFVESIITTATRATTDDFSAYPVMQSEARAQCYDDDGKWIGGRWGAVYACRRPPARRRSWRVGRRAPQESWPGAHAQCVLALMRARPHPVLLERCGMITIVPGRREERMDVSARERLRASVAEVVQYLELCPPSVQSTRDSGDGRRHVVLLDVPERLLPLLTVLLEREGVARDRSDPVRPAAPQAPRVMRPTQEDEAHVREFILDAGRTLTPDELRRWAETGDWPARCDSSV